MNPYDILGVPPHATDAEIKLAYRKLAKQFHPDVNKHQHEGMIKQLNEAYGILSNPARKAEYDGRINTSRFEYQEDPREVYKREYIARRKEEGRRQREAYYRAAAATYKFLRFIAMPGLLFASLIVIDRYLPQHEYQEVAEIGWQQLMGKSRRSHGELFSFMKTKHFIIAVPHEVHVDYDYNAADKQTLTIAVSPIFRIPSTVSLIKNGSNYIGDIQRTIFSDRFKLQYILLFTSVVVVFRRHYSDFNLSLAILALFALFFIWFFYF